MLLILAFLCLAAAFALVGTLVTQEARDRQASLRRARSYAVDEATDEPEPYLERLERRYGTALARVARRLDPRLTEERIARKLVTSGLARRLTPNGFLALKVVLAAAGALGGTLLGVLASRGGALVLLLGVGLGAFGFFLPDWVAAVRTDRRRQQMRYALPDALDILAVCVEAGLGFDDALGRLSQKMQGPLVDEFSLVLGELRVGETRAAALRRMADRIDLPEVTSVVSSLIQADELGSPLGRTLRVQAQESRHRRQVAADERAMKAPVKMMFPTLLFIFPAMFLVILGPALIEISKVF